MNSNIVFNFENAFAYTSVFIGGKFPSVSQGNFQEDYIHKPIQWHITFFKMISDHMFYCDSESG